MYPKQSSRRDDHDKRFAKLLTSYKENYKA